MFFLVFFYFIALFIHEWNHRINASCSWITQPHLFNGRLVLLSEDNWEWQPCVQQTDDKHTKTSKLCAVLNTHDQQIQREWEGEGAELTCSAARLAQVASLHHGFLTVDGLNTTALRRVGEVLRLRVILINRAKEKVLSSTEAAATRWLIINYRGSTISPVRSVEKGLLTLFIALFVLLQIFEYLLSKTLHLSGG